MEKDRNTPDGRADDTPVPPPAPWQTPKLVRMGSVTSLTSKVDNKGRGDGGKFSSGKYRT